jgi:hypothetical protein
VVRAGKVTSGRFAAEVRENRVLTEALIALASAGGTGLIEAISSDAWETAKAGFARVLGRGDTKRQAEIEQRLDRTRAEVQAAPAGTADQVRVRHQAQWTARLEDFLDEHPEHAEQVKSIVDTLAASTGSTGRVHQQVIGFDNAQQAVQGHGTQIVTFAPRAKE